MMDKPMQKTSYALPVAMLLTGAAIGAILGVLFAPDEGKETRRKLKLWMKERAEKGKDAFDHKREQVAAAIIAGRKAYEEVDQRKEPVLTR